MQRRAALMDVVEDPTARGSTIAPYVVIHQEVMIHYCFYIIIPKVMILLLGRVYTL